MTKKHLIIVGGVAAGMSAAAKARRTDPDLAITVYEKSGYVSYGACGFPYFIAGVFDEERKLIARTPEKFAKQGIAVHLHHEVLAIDPERQSIRVRDIDNEREFDDRYDSLILTTGGSAVQPRLPGLDLDGIFSLRTMEDALAIKAWIQEKKPRSGVVVGAGYIGLEMAEALAAHDIEVSIVEMLLQCMPTVDDDMSGLITDELKRHGVNVMLDHRVERFEGENGRVKGAVASGRPLPADIVILAVGIRPNIGLAHAAGITIGDTGAVAVDAYQQTNQPHIYAAGDIAEALDRVTGRPTWVPLATTASKQGKVAGENAAGGEARFNGIVGASVVKVFDLEVARTGLTEQAALIEGFVATTTTVVHDSRAGYYPGASPITLKLVYEKVGGRLLGAQMIGQNGVAKRIDVVSAALQSRWTISDLADLDMVYAPPFSPTWDVILIAATQALKTVSDPVFAESV